MRKRKQQQNLLHLQQSLQTLQTSRILRTSIKYNPLTLTKPWPVTASVNPVLQLLLIFILSTICPVPNTYILSDSMARMLPNFSVVGTSNVKTSDMMVKQSVNDFPFIVHLLLKKSLNFSMDILRKIGLNSKMICRYDR